VESDIDENRDAANCSVYEPAVTGSNWEDLKELQRGDLLEERKQYQVVVTGGVDDFPSILWGVDFGICTCAVEEECELVIAPSKAFSRLDKKHLANWPIIACLRIHDFSPEIDLTPPTHNVVKHVIAPSRSDFVDRSTGLNHPIAGARVKFSLSSISELTGPVGPFRSFDKAVVGGKETEAWIDMVICSMKKDEYCTATNAESGETVYVILREFENPRLPSNPYEAIEMASRYKEEGNQFFAELHPKAAEKYLLALQFLHEMYFPNNELDEKRRTLCTQLHGNLGQVFLTLRDYTRSIQHLTAALDISPLHKNYFRRAKAYRMKQQFELARADLVEVRMLLQQTQCPADHDDWKGLAKEVELLERSESEFGRKE
jgi:hypothetical protein